MEILSSAARDGYLYVRTEGDNSLASAQAVLQAVRRRAEEGGFQRILIDGREVGGDQSKFDGYGVGLAIASIFPSPYRVAILRKREHITKLGENTAVNRGADFLVCEGESEALAWLLRR